MNGVASVLLGNGDGTFRTAVTYGSGGYGVNFEDAWGWGQLGGGSGCERRWQPRLGYDRRVY